MRSLGAARHAPAHFLSIKRANRSTLLRLRSAARCMRSSLLLYPGAPTAAPAARMSAAQLRRGTLPRRCFCRNAVRPSSPSASSLSPPEEAPLRSRRSRSQLNPPRRRLFSIPESFRPGAPRRPTRSTRRRCPPPAPSTRAPAGCATPPSSAPPSGTPANNWQRTGAPAAPSAAAAPRPAQAWLGWRRRPAARHEDVRCLVRERPLDELPELWVRDHPLPVCAPGDGGRRGGGWGAGMVCAGRPRGGGGGAALHWAAAQAGAPFRLTGTQRACGGWPAANSSSGASGGAEGGRGEGRARGGGDRAPVQ